MKKKLYLYVITVTILCTLSVLYCEKTEDSLKNSLTEDTLVEADEKPNTDPKKITLTTLDWEPYIGQNMTNYGFVYELVVEAFKRVGITAEIKFYPWARTVSLSESGKRDGHFPEYYDKGRLKGWIFSNQFQGGPVGLYKRIDKKISYSVDPRTNQTEALRSIKKYKIGVVKEYINTNDFDRAAGLNIPPGTDAETRKKINKEKFLTVDFAESDEINLKKLYMNRVQLIFIDKFVAAHIIKTKLPDYAGKLEFLNPALQYNPLFICFSKKAPDYQRKCEAFNRGLNIIEQDGTLKIIMKKHGFY